MTATLRNPTGVSETAVLSVSRVPDLDALPLTFWGLDLCDGYRGRRSAENWLSELCAESFRPKPAGKHQQ